MKTFDNKISIRQLFIIFFIGICSPLIRLLPIQLSRLAGGTLWISPFINLVMFIILIYTLNAIFKKYPDSSLSEIIEAVFGKFLGKTLLVIYVLYFIIFTSLYIRYFGERLASTLYIYSSIKFFASFLLILIFFIVKNSIENLARLLEIFLYIFLGIILLITLFSLRDIHFTNFILPKASDFINNVKTIPLVTGVLSYVTFTLFLGNFVKHKDGLKKHGIKISILITVMSLIIIFISVGTFGSTLSEDLNLPFFSEIKNIRIFKTIERVESIFITMWLVTDFAIITTFIYIISNVCKYLCKGKDLKYISTPIIFIVYIGSFLIASNAFELDRFSAKIAPVFSFTLGFIIPLILLCVGKLRKKI